TLRMEVISACPLFWRSIGITLNLCLKGTLFLELPFYLLQNLSCNLWKFNRLGMLHLKLYQYVNAIEDKLFCMANLLFTVIEIFSKRILLFQCRQYWWKRGT